MDIRFMHSARVDRPVADVFRAVADPDPIARYFVASASGPLEPGAKVKWTWDVHGSPPVEGSASVKEVVKDEKIVFTWPASQVDYETEVTFRFEPHPKGGTRVTVEERGWKADQKGVDSALDHSGGWMHMLVCMKGWLEHGVDLRG